MGGASAFLGDGAGQEQEDSECRTQIRCARGASQKRTHLDENGILGATCTHGFALLHSFCNLLRPENFAYHLVRGASHAWEFSAERGLSKQSMCCVSRARSRLSMRRAHTTALLGTAHAGAAHVPGDLLHHRSALLRGLRLPPVLNLETVQGRADKTERACVA